MHICKENLTVSIIHFNLFGNGYHTSAQTCRRICVSEQTIIGVMTIVRLSDDGGLYFSVIIDPTVG